MYELRQLSEHDYYIDCPAKIGIVRIDEQNVIAIDSGSDKDAGKKVLRHLEAKGWKLKAIFNTHSHADHIGGNQFLQKKTGCRIYAPSMECVYTNHPILEPMTLYGGLPLKELKGKFLMAQPSDCQLLTKEVLPQGMDILELPGHSFDMVGFRTPDDNVFLADCLSSKETLAKYGIGYLWNIEQYIQSLEQVEKMNALQFIPAHAPVTDDITELARFNLEAAYTLLANIENLCREPKTFEDLLHDLFAHYQMTMTVQQYGLIGSTIRSCLSCLCTKGRMTCLCEDGYVKWQTVQ